MKIAVRSELLSPKSYNSCIFMIEREDKIDTRSSLLEVGLKLFAQSTYEGVSVQDIVVSAHVTKPTLYHYFKSKLGFYQAVYDTYVLPVIAMIAEKAEYHHDLTHNLNEIAKSTIEYFVQNPAALWLLQFSSNVSLHGEHYEYVMQKWQVLTQAVINMFNSAVEQHGNLRDKIDTVPWLFIQIVFAQADAVLKGKISYSNFLFTKFLICIL